MACPTAPRQHLFLGLSVAKFTTSMGWQNQGSRLTVTLYNDPCSGDKIYYDHNLQEQTWSYADPGFSNSYEAPLYLQTGDALVQTTTTPFYAPTNNIPVFFKTEDFEYCGLVQGIEEGEGIGGEPTYDVHLMDPRELLEGIQLITGKYGASVGNTFNVLNVYGLMESIRAGTVCGGCANPSFADLGDFYGGSLANEAGMPWALIKKGVHILTARQNVYVPDTTGLSNFARGGRAMFAGDVIGRRGMGYLPIDSRFSFLLGKNYTQYFIDLSQIPDEAGFSSSFFLRLGGETSISLMDAIDQACAYLGLDYFIDLVPAVVPGSTNPWHQCFIKVRTCSKFEQRSFTPSKIVEFANQKQAEGLQISLSHGYEGRNEPVQGFLIGGPKRELASYIGTETSGLYYGNDSQIFPYWGLHSTTWTDSAGASHVYEDIVFGSGTNDDHTVRVNISHLGLYNVNTSGLITEYEFSVGELRAAEVGQDVWMSYVAGSNHPIADALQINGTFGLNPAALAIFQDADEQVWKTVDLDALFTLQQDAAQQAALNPYLNEVQAEIFSLVTSYASEYYGTKFCVPTNQVCIKYLPDDLQFLTSHEPSQEGGWPTEATLAQLSTVGIGLDDLINFINDDGLVQAFVGVLTTDKLNQVDFSRLSPDNYYIEPNTGTLYVRCDIEPNLAYQYNATKCFPYVIVSLREPFIVRKNTGDVKQLSPGMLAIVGQQSTAIGRDTAKERLQFLYKQKQAHRLSATIPLGPECIQPDWITVPIKSNISTYGPWSSEDFDLSSTCISVGVALAPIINPPPGKVRVEYDEELVPWHFGSEESLNCFARIKARDMVARVQVEELGAVEVPGLPEKPLSHEIGANIPALTAVRLAEPAFYVFNNVYTTYRIIDRYSGGSLVHANANSTRDFSGCWQGLHGPNITSIDCSMSAEGGLKTKYSFRTNTPEYGNFAKQNIERFRRLGQANLAIRKSLAEKVNTLRNTVISRAGRVALKTSHGGGGGGGNGGHAGVAKGGGIGFFNVADKIGRNATGPSKHHNALVGNNRFHEISGAGYESGVLTWVSPKVSMGDVLSMGAEGTNIEDRYSTTESGTNTMHLAGLETLFRPVTIFVGPIGELNAWDTSTMVARNADSSGTVVDSSGLPRVNAITLNPFQNPGGFLDPSGSEYNGHDMTFLTAASGGSGEYYRVNQGVAYSAYGDTYRALALRGPLIVTGFGFDTQGRPVPNAGGDSNYFHPDYLRRSDLWKTGPVKLLWDEDDKCWVGAGGGGGGSTDIRLMRLETNLELDGADDDGNGVAGSGYFLTDSSPAILANPLSQPLASGQIVAVYQDSTLYPDMWIPLRAEHQSVCFITSLDCHRQSDDEFGIMTCKRAISIDTAVSDETCWIDGPTSGDAPDDNCPTIFNVFNGNTSGQYELPDDPGGHGWMGFNILSFGAVGDGVTDDTIAIQSAFNYAAGADERTLLYFPNGNYLVSNTGSAGVGNYALEISGSQIAIMGEGDGTIIQVASGDSSTVITTATSENIVDFILKDIVIDGNWEQIPWGYENYQEISGAIDNSGNAVAGIYDQHGLVLNNVKSFLIDNVKIRNVGMDGFQINSCKNGVVDRCTVEFCGKRNGAITMSQDISITNCYFENANDSPDYTTKPYYYSYDGYASIEVNNYPIGYWADSVYSNIYINGNNVYNTTGRGIFITNGAVAVNVNSNTIYSNTHWNTLINGRTMLDARASEQLIISHNILNNAELGKSISYGVQITGVDSLILDGNHINGARQNLIENCARYKVVENNTESTSGVFALGVIGNDAAYGQNCHIQDNTIRDHYGDVGIYIDYLKNSKVDGNLAHNFTTTSGTEISGCLFIDHTEACSIGSNINMDGIGIQLSSSGTVSGCVIHDNIALNHIFSTLDKTNNVCHHNIPSDANSTETGGSTSGTAVYVDVSGVLFGGALGTISTDVPNLYWDDSNDRLFVKNLDSNGVLVSIGDVEVSTVGSGYIFKSPNGTRFRVTILDDGRLVAVSL
jgi:hypothetical protein